MSEKYVATALILVRPQENLKISPTRDNKELLNYPVSGGAKVEVPSNTYIQVIKSRAIAEKVVRMLHLDRDDDMPAKPAEQEVFALSKKLLRDFLQLSVQVLKYGRVIGETPPFTAAVDRIEGNLSLTAIKDTYLFEIKYEADNPKESADVANAAAALFLEYMVEINTPDAKRKLDFLEERLRESERELAKARHVLRQFKDKNKTISFKEETTEEIKLRSELETDLEKTEVKLAGLLKELTPSHPKVESVQAARDRLLSTLNYRKNKINDLPEKEKQLATFELDVRVAEEIYQFIKKEHEEAQVRAGKENSEIKVVSPAVAPLYPAKPVRVKYGVVALSMAFLLGIGLALAREYLTRRLTRIEDVERVLLLPVLATIPEMDFLLYKRRALRRSAITPQRLAVDANSAEGGGYVVRETL